MREALAFDDDFAAAGFVEVRPWGPQLEVNRLFSAC